MSKKCTKCNKSKPDTQFYVSSKRCKSCIKKYRNSRTEKTKKESLSIDPEKFTRQCTSCGETKPLIYYGMLRHSKYGRRSVCKDCKREKDVGRKKRDGDSLVVRLGKWKRGAKERNIKWELTDKYVLGMKHVCHYTGAKLSIKRNRPNTISMDRKDSSKGYVKGNVVFCCAQINVMKMQLSVKDFRDWCGKVAEYSGSKKTSK